MLSKNEFKTLIESNKNWYYNDIFCIKYADEILEYIDIIGSYVEQLPEVIVRKVLELKNYKLLKKFYNFSKRYPNLVEEYNEAILDYINQLEYNEAIEFMEDTALNDNKFFCIQIFEKNLEKFYFIFDNKVYDKELVEKYKSKFIAAINDKTIIKDVLKINEILVQEAIRQDKSVKILSKFALIPELFKSEKILTFYANKLKISKIKLKEKIDYLTDCNEDIFFTMNLEILKDKYSIINLKHIEKIGLYVDMQDVIINLDIKELKLISRILDKLDSDDYDYSSLAFNILKNFKLYKNLIKNIVDSNLSEEQINNLIIILYKEENYYEIEKSDDLIDENFERKKKEYFNKVDTRIDNKTINISDMKKELLLKKYSLSYNEAKFIYERYCLDFKYINSSNLSGWIKLLLENLKKIIESNNFSYLKFVYDNSEILDIEKFSLESEIRKEYAKIYSDSLYKLKSEHLLDEAHILYQNQRSIYDNIHKVQYKGKTPKFYLLNGEFNIQTHMLGLFSYENEFDDYKKSWNRPKIEYHGICTSFFGSDMISYFGDEYTTKKPYDHSETNLNFAYFGNLRKKRPMYGFSSYEESALLLAGNKDLYSCDAIRSYDTSLQKPYSFYTPQAMKNNTSDGSEIVIERRNNVKGKSFKRQPDYIVYVVDDIKKEYNFSIDNKLFVDTVKSAIDWDLPIVLIDKSYYSKFNEEKKQKILNDFEKNKDVNNLNNLFELIFNNQIWNEKFNYTCFYDTYIKVLKIIENICNPKMQLFLLTNLLFIFDEEREKNRSSIVFLPGINDKLEEIIDDLKSKIVEMRSQYGMSDQNDIIDFIASSSVTNKQLLIKDYLNNISLEEIKIKHDNGDYNLNILK